MSHREPNPWNLTPGDAVAFTGWGGEVRLIDVHQRGVVVRLNRSGFPVILIEKHTQETGTRTLTDRYGVARAIGEDGKLKGTVPGYTGI
jgi:hypothetical protein